MHLPIHVYIMCVCVWNQWCPHMFQKTSELVTGRQALTSSIYSECLWILGCWAIYILLIFSIVVFQKWKTSNSPKFKSYKKTNWLVVSTPLKNISQLGWLFLIYAKRTNNPNHQPATWTEDGWISGNAIWGFSGSVALNFQSISVPYWAGPVVSSYPPVSSGTSSGLNPI